VLEGRDRFGALVVGPGLGRAEGTADAVRSVVAGRGDTPLVVDGDGLAALGPWPAVGPGAVLTPHDGEHARLAGGPPGPDRLDAARVLAARTGAVVLLKGSTTVVAEPGGEALLVTAGDARLATAGTGDVLAGVIGALLAGGLDPLRAAAAGAHLHGRAGALGWRRGLVAGDLPDLLPPAVAGLSPT
jgi:NAD(P)H-hydrate epimerase